MLSKKQLFDICMLNGLNKRCRYLGNDDVDPSKYVCLKLTTSKKKIDDKITELVIDGMPAHIANGPMGNNCDGYPLLKHIEQGYDK